MSPRVISVNAEHPEKSAIDEAVAILRRGGLVAFPTETVYGLGARAFDHAAVKNIFEAKGRPAAHPIIAHVLDENGATSVAAEWNDLASTLARAFWPGPLTIIAPKRAEIPNELTGGGDSVGIRAPSHPVARALLAALGEPIAAPSANRFQQISPTLAAHVVKSLGDKVDLVLDGGACARGIESTVVAISKNEIHLLRPGSISKTALGEFGKVIYENRSAAADEMRASPGLDAKHYAPLAKLLVTARDHIATRIDKTKKHGIILRGKSAPIDAFAVRVLPNDADGFASSLFSTLHDLDDLGCTVIIVEAPPETDAWIAVRDRLSRAAATSS